MKARVWAILGLLTAMIFVFSLVSTACAVGITATVKVGKAPGGLAYDSGKGEIYVPNGGGNTVSVISESTNTVVTSVTVGNGPYKAIYDSGKGEIFVDNYASNSVSVISDSTNKVVATITGFTEPAGSAYDSGKGEVFVINHGTNDVAVISDTTNSIVATVHVGSSPYNAVYDSGKGEVFVSNALSGSVSVISDESNTVVATVTGLTGPLGLAYDSEKGEIFVANSSHNTVSVISDSTNTVIATINVGSKPYGIAYDSGKSEIFVSNHDSNTISIISDSTNAEVANVTVGGQPYGVVYDSNMGEVFVTNAQDGTVSVISDGSNTSKPSNPSSSNSTTPSIPSNSNSTSSSTPGLAEQVWVPPPANAIASVGVSAVLIGAVSLVFAAVSNPLGGVGGALAEKTRDMLPDRIKEWLEEVVASRHKVGAVEKTGSLLLPTKTEIAAYIVSIIVLAVSFSYVKVIDFSQFWELLPIFFATGILVGFVQKFFAIVYLRSKGVWSEIKIWPFGLVLFLFTTFAFRVPFSSPTRSAHSSKFTERLGAITSASEILIGLAFAALFYVLLNVGFAAVGGAGLTMCVIGSFVGTFPVSPMSGKDIFNHSKRLWAILFLTTVVIFAAWLLLL